MILNYIKTQNVAVTSGSASEADTIQNADYPLYVALTATSAFKVSIGETATTDSPLFPANEVHVFDLPAGSTVSIFGVANTTVSVSEVTIVSFSKVPSGELPRVAWAERAFFGGSVANQTVLLAQIPHDCTITSVVTKASAGTGTVTVYVAGAPLGGGSNSATSSEVIVTHATANDVNAGDDITIVVTSASSLMDLAVSINGTRVL